VTTGSDRALDIAIEAATPAQLGAAKERCIQRGLILRSALVSTSK